MTNLQYWTGWGIAMGVFAVLGTVLIWKIHVLTVVIQQAITKLP